MTKPATIVLFAVWLAVSMGLKVVRYSQSSPELSAAGAKWREFMEMEGWRFAGHGAGELAHTRYIFTRDSCPNQVTVIVLGSGAETQGLIETEFQGRVRYFQNGEMTERPSLLKNSAGRLVAALKGLFNPALNNTHPLFAVAPPPPEVEGSCAGPSAAAWRGHLARLAGE